MKNLSIAIAVAMFSASCFGLEPAHASHPEYSPSEHTEGIQDYLVVPPGAKGRPAYYEPSGGLYKFLATSKETGGAFSLFNFLIPPGGGTIPHTHLRGAELFYILDGGDFSLLTVKDGTEETRVLGPGSFAYLPLGRPHSFTDNDTETVSTLSLITPGGIDEFFAQIGRPEELGPGGPDYTYDNIVQQYPEAFAKIQFTLPQTVPGAIDFIVKEPEAQVGPYTSLATTEQTSGPLSDTAVLAEIFSLSPSQSGLPPLTQSSDAESFYILDGELTFQLGNQTAVAPTDTYVYIPPDKTYAFTNVGTTPAKVLSISVTSVPEPSSGLGVLGCGAFLSASLVFKHKHKKQKSANL